MNFHTYLCCALLGSTANSTPRLSARCRALVLEWPLPLAAARRRRLLVPHCCLVWCCPLLPWGSRFDVLGFAQRIVSTAVGFYMGGFPEIADSFAWRRRRRKGRGGHGRRGTGKRGGYIISKTFGSLLITAIQMRGFSVKLSSSIYIKHPGLDRDPT
jgi:hypothetical protein